jgi:DNA polymerase elongation subunit (family B)
LGNPVFAQVHDYVAAEDCTMLGQQFIKYARHTFEEAGYELLYTHTDSVYICDPYGNEKRVKETRDNIIEFIKKSVPFPQDTFDMDIDDYIKRIYFFKNESGDYLKNNYVYLTREDKLKVKGLQIIKSNATKLGKKIFFDHIAPKIKENGQYTFKKSQIESWIESALIKDMSLVSNSFRVKPWETYANESQIQAQISKHFGEGTHAMVKINRSHLKGIGRASNYITLEQAREVHMSWFDLEGTWNELRHFIEPQKSLEAFF